MSNISIDVRMMKHSGIGTYIRNLVPQIISLMPEHHFYLLGYEPHIRADKIFQTQNVTPIQLSSGIYSIREQFELRSHIPKNTDLFWSPHYNIPLMYRGKLLVTVHDCYHLRDNSTSILQKIYANTMFHSVQQKANHILCVSEFSRGELESLLGKRISRKTSVAYNGSDQLSAGEPGMSSPYSKPYFLFVGNVKPNKNLTRLLMAFERIMHKVPHDLMIVGKEDGFITGDSDVPSYAKRLGNRLHFTGYVNDSELVNYLQHAAALVFPSLYEGFGLPPLEAMRMGCPVIVSDRTSLPEICGDSALYCDPYNPDQIGERMLEVVQNLDLRAQLIAKGYLRAETFTWMQCALETSAVIRKVLQ